MSKQISTEDFDRRFDEGEDITAFLDTSAIRHPNREKKTVNVDFPLWMVNALDKEAKTLGVSRRRSSRRCSAGTCRNARASEPGSATGDVERLGTCPSPLGLSPSALSQNAKRPAVSGGPFNLTRTTP